MVVAGKHQARRMPVKKKKSLMIHDSITSSPKRRKRELGLMVFKSFVKILLCNLTMVTSGSQRLTVVKLSLFSRRREL